MRRTLLALMTAVGFAAISPVAAQGYPAKPVRVINPFAPGGGLDLAIRPVLQKMSESVKQQFVIENRPGAATNVGTDLVAHAPADGPAHRGRP